METKECIDNKFIHAILVALRAKQLVKGAKPKINFKYENPLTLALEEVNQGMIQIHFIEKEEQKVLSVEIVSAVEVGSGNPKLGD